MADIIIADDNAELLAQLGQILRMKGHKVTSSNNGANVLCLLGDGNTDRPDLLILDVRMPGLNGPDVVSMLKPNDPHVILMSGTPIPKESIDTSKVKYVLTKPFQPSELFEAIDKVIKTEVL
jgi:DNA-binding response OmpR family regulator